MSEIAKHLRGYISGKRVPLKEKWNPSRFSVASSGDLDTYSSTGDEYTLEIRWRQNFILAPPMNTSEQRKRCEEKALHLFTREVFGEFEPILTAMEREVMLYADNSELLEMIYEMRRRMFHE